MLSRPRFTVRRLMAAVAITGLALGGYAALRQRAARFRRMAEYHHARTGRGCVCTDMPPEGLICQDQRGEWAFPSVVDRHESLRAKYDLAARRPWLPVAPDPPEPERPDGATASVRKRLASRPP